MTRIYNLESGGVKGTALAVLVVAGGALIVAFGLALLLALAAAGAVLGAGVLVYRRLTGRPTPSIRSPRTGRLDPTLEVFSDDPVVTDQAVRELPDSDPRR